MGRSDSLGRHASRLFLFGRRWLALLPLPVCQGLSCSSMDYPTAPPSLTPESSPPALEHCLGENAGFTTSERLAALDWLNEARFGSLALRLGSSLGRALARRIAPARHRLRYMFNVQFTWQSPFILLV